MKTNLIFLVLLCCIKAYAQDSVTITSSSRMSEAVFVDSAYGSLDTTRMSTKYLLDRVPVNFGEGKYNGLDGSVVDTIKSAFIFDEIYSSVYLSQVNNNPHFTDPLIFDHNADSEYHASNDSVVPVMMFMGEYNCIDTVTYGLGWVHQLNPWSVELLDAELPNIPYDTFGVFAAMAVRQKIYAAAGHFYFRFSSDFFATNIPADAGGTVTVDFGDGAGAHSIGMLAVGPGLTLQANYVTEGPQTITITYAPVAGPHRTSSFVVYVYPLPLYDLYPEPWNFGYDGVPNSAKAYYYAGCDQQLDKPIIIVEGFDPNNSMQYNEIYDNFNSPVTVGGVNHSLAADLRSLGYDVFILMFDYNQDYIENNAKYLEALIKNINDNKFGDDKIVVIGESMGGLIARYAIKDMENNGPPPNVGLYVSYDAPQQGAYVPVGMQGIFEYMHQDIGGLSKNNSFMTVYNSFNSPAAQEMLIYGMTTGSSGSMLHSNRITFANKLDTMGYPTTCRKIAVTNGSQTGAGQSYGGDTHIFDWSIITLLDDIKADAWSLPNYGTSSTQIMYWDYTVFVPIAPLTIGIDNRSMSVSRNQPFDNQPGGQENTQEQFVSSISQNVPIGSVTDYGHDNHCFVPTVSALDLNDQNYGEIGVEWYPHNPSEALTPSYILTHSPFSAVVNAESPSVNEFHTWMFDSIYTFLYRNIVNSSLILTTDLGIGGFKYYNFAPGTPSVIDGDRNYNGLHLGETLDIGDDGGDGAVLQVNGNAKAGFSTSSGSVPPARSTYTLTLGGCSPDTIHVHNHGKLVIGDSSGNKGVFHVLAFSVIVLDAGASIEIYDSSSLIFEQYSYLVCEGTPTIKLFGSSAALDFNGGQLVLDNNVTFHVAAPLQFVNTYSELYGEGLGFVRFTQAPADVGYPDILTSGSHASFMISGSGDTHKVLEVSENSYVYPDAGISFSINGGEILMDNGARINTHDSLYFHNVGIDELYSGSPHDGIHTYGQAGVQVSCAVAHATTGFTDYSAAGGGYVANLIGCSFNNCGTAVYCYNVPVYAGLHIANSADDAVDISAGAGLDPSFISGTGITNSGGDGIHCVFGSTASELDLDDMYIDSSGGNGIYAASANVYMRCMAVADNSGYGILAASPGINLTMAPYYATDFKTGYNNMYNNSSGNIEFVESSAFDLDYGENAFSYTSGNNINGNIGTRCPGWEYAGENYWDKSGTVETSLSSGVDDYIIETCAGVGTLLDLIDLYPQGSWADPMSCTTFGGGGGGGSDGPEPAHGGSGGALWAQPQSTATYAGAGQPGGAGDSALTSHAKVNRFAAILDSAKDQALSALVSRVMDSLNINTLPIPAYNALASALENKTKQAIAVDRPMVDLAYCKMLQCVTKILEAKFDSSQKSGLIAAAYTVQNHLFGESEGYKDSFQYARDEAILHRDAGDRATALAHLAMLRTYAHPDSYNYIDQWECWIANEIAVANGAINIDKFNPASTCHYSTAVTYPVVASVKKDMPADGGKAQNTLSISPNPVCEICNVDYSLGDVYNVRVQVISMTGQVLLFQNLGRQGAGAYHINLPANQFKEGVYIVKLLTDNQVMEDKFVKSR